jgi:ferric-dicitrate binding protein FerR (iron transport regulator)
VLRRARLGLASAALVASSLALWVALRPATLHVERVAGLAAVVTSEGRHVAKVGETLKAGDQLATAAGQKIEVQWPDGTRVWLSPEGEAALLDGNRGMRLKRGRVWAHVAKQQTGFRVEGPGATAEVLGTQFQVRADAKGNTWLAVWQGRVRFFNKKGSVVATAWKQTGAQLGSAPAALADYSPLGRDSLWWLE